MSRELSPFEREILLRLAMVVQADAMTEALSPKLSAKLEQLVAETDLPESANGKAAVVGGLERLIHRLRFSMGEDVEDGLTEPIKRR